MLAHDGCPAARLAAEITAGTLTADPAPLPLSQAETAWNTPPAAGRRIVFVP